jgi:hypothetical protein
MEGPQVTPKSSPGRQQFGYLASSLAQLVDVARRELEHDREAAKASLATVSTILQTEIERQSGARRSRTAGLAGWQGACFHRQESGTYHSHTGPERRRTAKPGALLAVVQAHLWRATACLCCEEAAGEGLSSHDHQFGIPERDRPERRIFRSGASVQALQAGIRAEPGELAARARDPVVRSSSRELAGMADVHERSEQECPELRSF